MQIEINEKEYRFLLALLAEHINYRESCKIHAEESGNPVAWKHNETMLVRALSLSARLQEIGG